MVEVNLRLFVTCRLCLDVQGHFQIDPNVQQQIKYCFDIDVEPFDGLPQLICKKCENILREHYAIKKNFIEKQKELKTGSLQENARKGEKSLPQQDESTNWTKANVLLTSGLDDEDSTNFKDDYHEKNTRKKKKVKKRRKVKRRLSSSGDDLESNDLSETQINSNATHKEDIISWDANFNKYFVCRICSQGFQDKEDITKHIKKHSILQMKFKNVFKMSCLVVMQKIDNKPNMCNNNKSVVYSPDYVIQNNHNQFYYTKYLPKTYSDITNSFKYISKNNIISAESSDGEVIRRKRRRLLSRSSSETVVLNRNSEQEDTSHLTEYNRNPPTVIDLIDLGDSSDNESYESTIEKPSNSIPIDSGKLDSKPMQNIIKMCLNKYNKRIESRERNTVRDNYKGKEDFLQHKVLSIGRKVIHNKGFNCTGLLRFLEYKDLSVIWKETSVLKANNDGKYVRIATRVRGNEISDPNNAGWKNYCSSSYECEYNFMSKTILDTLKTFGDFEKSEDIYVKKQKGSDDMKTRHTSKKKSEFNTVKNEEDIDTEQKLPCISAVFSQSDLETSKIDSDNILKKLLNKNPVSNPKQLPKKANTNDINPKPMKVFSAPNTVPVVSVKQTEENNEMETNAMPIVTSTVSLAHLFDNEKNNSAVTTNTTITTTNDPVTTSNNQQPTYPRIKVKPVSELMPEKLTATINGTQNASQISSLVWPTQNMSFDTQQSGSDQTISAVIGNSQISFVKQQAWPNQNIPMNEQHNTNSVNNVSTPSRVADAVLILKECMLLDTVEFPNTKTTSPFQYFRDLLLVHNITLLEADKPMPAGSANLIKLKLVYQQEKCEPIALCSVLQCFKNIFSIQIKDQKRNTHVNINTLSANWQWQLLKIYNDEVITKIMQTAALISTETYKYSKQFFALLKSIKSKNVMT